MGSVRNSYNIKLIFAFIQNKTVDIYKNIFKIIFDKYNEIGLILMSNIFVLDFVDAIHKNVIKKFLYLKL